MAELVRKPIRFSAHALSYRVRRGFTEAEVVETIQSSKWEPAELGRLQCSKDFAFGKEWNDKVYATKKVQPIFVEEEKEIFVITVYTYYY
jgi:hypothetical protein